MQETETRDEITIADIEQAVKAYDAHKALAWMRANGFAAVDSAAPVPLSVIQEAIHAYCTARVERAFQPTAGLI